MKYAKRERRSSGKLVSFLLIVLSILVVVGLGVLVAEYKPWEYFTKHLPEELKTVNNDAQSAIELTDEYELALYYPDYLPESYLSVLQKEVADFKAEHSEGRLYIDYKEVKDQEFVSTTFYKGSDNTVKGEELFTEIFHIPSKSDVNLEFLFEKNYLEALAVYCREDLIEQTEANIDQRLEIYRLVKANPACFENFRIENNALIFDFSLGSVSISFEKMAYYLRQSVNGIASSEQLNDKIRYLDPDKPMLALTFDDGPYTSVSNRLLDALEDVGGLATFFIVGSRANYYQDVIKREVEMGCEVGSHTYEHLNLTKLTAEQMQQQYQKVEDAIHEFLPEHQLKVLRPVGGAYNSYVQENTPYPMFNWNVDTLDWQSRDGDTVYQNIMDNAQDGNIILMHDLYPTTADACEKAIPELAEKYQLVTVLELLEYKGVRPEAGNVYFFVR